MDRHFKRPFPHPVAPSPPPAVPPARSRPAAAALDSSHRPLALRAEGGGRAAGWGLKRGRGNHHAPHENVTDVRHCRSLTGCTAVQSFALPSNETGITSYSDETLTEEVGYTCHGCSGEHFSTDSGLRMESLRLHLVKGTSWVRSIAPSMVTGHGAQKISVSRRCSNGTKKGAEGSNPDLQVSSVGFAPFRKMLSDMH